MSETTRGKGQTMGSVRWIGGVILALVVLLLIYESQVEIASGHIGVLTQYGAATGTELDPGLHFKVPFVQSVADFNTQVQIDQSRGVEAASADLQTVDTQVAVNYHPDPAHITALYQQVGVNYRATIIDPAILESVKAVTAKFTASQLIERRAAVKAQIDSVLSSRLAAFHILIDTVSVTNFTFSAQFNAAIEAKQVAQQAVLTAQQHLDQSRIDAQQHVVQAQAQAQAQIAQATGAAQAQVITATANAKAQALQRQSLTPLYLELLAVQRWNGILPQYMANGNLPFLTTPTK